MDNFTHTLTGIALGQAGLKRKTRFGMSALIIASNLPDADVVMAMHGGITYLKYHRGITHSLIGLTVLAAILAIVLYAAGRRSTPGKNAPPLNLKWLFLLCWSGAALHVWMDFTNAYGIRPYLPFSGRWYALDIMPIIDPWLLFILAAGLCVPGIMGLVMEEVGSRKANAKAVRNGAVFSLCVMAALWGVRDLSRHRALNLLGARTYGGEDPERIGAFPTALNPFAWTGVVETDSAVYLADVSALASDATAERPVRFQKSQSSPALTVAEKTPAAKVFLNFARFPYALVYAEEDGFHVYIRDLRFARPGTRYWNFVLTSDVDLSLRLKKQTFRFSMRKPLY